MSANLKTLSLQLPQSVARHLLNFMKWNTEKLVDKLYDSDRDDLFKSAGLFDPPESQPGDDDSAELCDICVDESSVGALIDLRCGHKFCDDCFRHYLSDQLRNNAMSDCIKCAAYPCDWILDDELVLQHLKDRKQREKYEEMICRTYIRYNQCLRNCPAPGCEFIIECPNTSQMAAECLCGFKFCFACGFDCHSPLPCKLMKRWMVLLNEPNEKFSEEFIKSCTKPCPKCHVRIVKEGGCHNMRCTRCSVSFCWLCSFVYSKSSIHKCNLYQPYNALNAVALQRDDPDQPSTSAEALPPVVTANEPSGIMSGIQSFFSRALSTAPSTREAPLRVQRLQEAQLRKRTALQKEHKFYYYKSRYLAVVTARGNERVRFASMRREQNEPMIAAIEGLAQCRRILIDSYIFAFFLMDGNQKIIFEQNFQNLGDATEELSVMLKNCVLGDSSVDVRLKEKLM